MKSLDDLFLHMVKDMYYAERQILKALPKMARAASAPELKAAFEQHRVETEGQVERLQKVFEALGKAARGVKCEAIEGLVEEAEEVMQEAEDPKVLDAGLLAAAQAVEHYEIARYGTLRTWAVDLGKKDVAKLLEETLAEESACDKLLSKLAMGQINRKAA